MLGQHRQKATRTVPQILISTVCILGGLKEMHVTDAVMSSGLKVSARSRSLGGSHQLNQARKSGLCQQRDTEKKETSRIIQIRSETLWLQLGFWRDADFLSLSPRRPVHKEAGMRCDHLLGLLSAPWSVYLRNHSPALSTLPCRPLSGRL